jgi:hypothetical protein
MRERKTPIERNAVNAPIWVVARGFTREAMGVLVTCMRAESAPWSARIAAAGEVLNRGWGKAPVVVAGDGENPVRVRVDGLPAAALAAIERALLPLAAQVIEGQSTVVEETAAEDSPMPSAEDGSRGRE